MNRKDFFKKIAFTIGDTVAEKIEEVQQNIEGESELNSEQKDFLQEYMNWLTEFQYYVQQRNKNLFDSKNNMKLMELSKEAEKRKSVLEQHMKDGVFYQHFNLITAKVTELIS